MYTPKRQSLGRDKARSQFNYSSPFSEERSSRRFSAKTSLQVLEQGDNHQLLRLNSSLPVNLSEELSRNSYEHGSMSIQPSGWCYFVNNRKAFLWNFSAGTLSRKSTTCSEFNLCSTELQNKSSLFCVMDSALTDMLANKTSVVYVSPEGIVRYWQDISRPSAYIEASMNLAGKSCHFMVFIKPYGCVVATTTNDLYLLSFCMNSVHCQLLSVQSGMLSNIGRRMSSFWTQSAEVSNKYPPCVCDGTVDYDERYFYMATDNQLQKWQLKGDQECSAKVIYEANLMSCLKIYSGETNLSLGEVCEIEVVSIKNTGAGLVMLMKVLLRKSLHVVLGTFCMRGDDTDGSFDRIVEIELIIEKTSETCLVVPTGSYNAFISTKHTIVSVPLSATRKQPIIVHFDDANQGLIGSGYYGGDPVYLCRRNGFISLKVHSYNVSEEISERISRVEVDEAQKVAAKDIYSGDAYTTVKNAFKNYSADDKALIQLKVWSRFSLKEIEAAVLVVSEEIMNNSPATDPRWSSSAQKDHRSTSNQPLLLFNQLNDKENIHKEFIKFLKISKIWDEVLRNCHVKFRLVDDGEKLHCAMSLLDLYSNFSTEIDHVIASIESEVVNRDERARLIAKKDLVFSRVTDIGYFFVGLVKEEIQYLTETNAVQKQVEHIVAVGEILTTCYIACWRYRQTTQEQHGLSAEDNIPWTGGDIYVDNRSLLMQQIKISFEHALPRVDSTKVGATLAQHVVLIADILLDGYEKEVRILSSKRSVNVEPLVEEFHERRRYVIQNLVDCSYIEEAMRLAEKYEDFCMLITLCEKTNDVEKLEQYKVMFKDQGFLDVLYKWYMGNGNWGRLLSMKEATDEDFSSVLTSHPYLSWIHHVGSNKYAQASESLKSLADDETIFAARKKMMLVMSSLTVLASDHPQQEQCLLDIERDLDLLEYQNFILKTIGRSTNTKPISAQELIQLCLDSQVHVLEECYQSVAQLFHYVVDLEERNELMSQFWCKCIMDETWDACAMLQFNAIVSKKLFCKSLKYCSENDTLQQFIPRLTELLQSSEELADRMETDVSFKQQLQACYELLNL